MGLPAVPPYTTPEKYYRASVLGSQFLKGVDISAFHYES